MHACMPGGGAAARWLLTAGMHLLPRPQALFPGLRRCFQLDMLAGGRRGGQLVRVEPAVETSGKHAGMVFRSKHPRFYPAP